MLYINKVIQHNTFKPIQHKEEYSTTTKSINCNRLFTRLDSMIMKAQEGETIGLLIRAHINGPPFVVQDKIKLVRVPHVS